MSKELNEKVEFDEEEFLEEIEYITAPSLVELQKKVNNRIEKDYGVIEQNPFWDESNKLWVQTVLYYNYENESE